MDRESLVLFAMLSGGDYNTDGLPNCGPQIARKIARKQSGLAHALCQASKHELPAWRLRLEEAFHQAGKRIPVPFTFPDWKALGHYSNPVVTPENELRNLICLRNGWDPKIDQAKLRVLLRRRFNMWTKGYMKHVAPVFMIKQLARCQPHDEVLVENLKYDIQVKKTRKQKPLPGEDAVIALETKITFYPLPAVDIEIFEPEGEDWSIFEKDGSHYDPAGHIECNVLNCFLEHGLPQGFLVAPEPPKRQRKSKAATTASDQVVTDVTPPVLQGLDSETTAAVENAPKKRGRPKKSSTTTSPDAASADIVPKKRGRLPKDGNTPSAKQPPKKPKGRQEIDDQVQPPAPVFRLPPAFSFTSSASSTQSPGDSTQPGQSSELLNQQAGPTRRAIDSFSQSPRPPNTPQAHPTPKAGEAASPATLRALRAATWDFTGPKAVTPTSSSGTLRAVPPAIPSGAVYIDLTD